MLGLLSSGLPNNMFASTSTSSDGLALSGLAGLANMLLQDRRGLICTLCLHVMRELIKVVVE